VKQLLRGDWSSPADHTRLCTAIGRRPGLYSARTAADQPGHLCRRDSHPICFQQITLEFVLTSADTVATDMDKALHLVEETYCPVWAMLKGNVEVKTEYRIKVG
jgi:organic hydroperoxide reductase OsmC/OhrA